MESDFLFAVFIQRQEEESQGGGGGGGGGGQGMTGNSDVAVHSVPGCGGRCGRCRADFLIAASFVLLLMKRRPGFCRQCLFGLPF